VSVAVRSLPARSSQAERSIVAAARISEDRDYEHDVLVVLLTTPPHRVRRVHSGGPRVRAAAQPEGATVRKPLALSIGWTGSKHCWPARVARVAQD
jgi:hypothetical protein